MSPVAPILVLVPVSDSTTDEAFEALFAACELIEKSKQG